jgi:hypothetical protein
VDADLSRARGARPGSPAARERQAHVLERVGAPHNVRLACQTPDRGRKSFLCFRPRRPSATPAALAAARGEGANAILFAVAEFTKFSSRSCL